MKTNMNLQALWSGLMVASLVGGLACTGETSVVFRIPQASGNGGAAATHGSVRDRKSVV